MEKCSICGVDLSSFGSSIQSANQDIQTRSSRVTLSLKMEKEHKLTPLQHQQMTKLRRKLSVPPSPPPFLHLSHPLHPIDLTTNPPPTAALPSTSPPQIQKPARSTAQTSSGMAEPSSLPLASGPEILPSQLEILWLQWVRGGSCRRGRIEGRW